MARASTRAETESALDESSVIAAVWLSAAQFLYRGLLGRERLLEPIAIDPREVAPDVVYSARAALRATRPPRRYVIVSAGISLLGAFLVVPWALDRPYLFVLAPLCLWLFTLIIAVLAARVAARSRVFLHLRLLEPAPVVRRTWLLLVTNLYPGPLASGVFALLCGGTASLVAFTLLGPALGSVVGLLALVVAVLVGRSIWSTPWGRIRWLLSLAILQPSAAEVRLGEAARIDSAWVHRDQIHTGDDERAGLSNKGIEQNARR